MQTSALKCFGQSSEWWLRQRSIVVWLGEKRTMSFSAETEEEHAPSINLKLKACVCFRKKLA